MLPLALVAGFLGAGKTTFLASYARRVAGRRRIVFLVNEFAASDIDSPVLAAVTPCVVGVAGGSIFCRCKVTEFISRLSVIGRDFPDADGVVVEASGMADPSAARSLLDEAGLDRSFVFTGTVTLVDPGSLPKVLDTLPAAERQVTAADAVVVGKSDLHPAAAVADCEALVRGLNPTARLIRAVRGACDLDPLALGSERWVDGMIAECADPALVGMSIDCPRPVRLAAVAAAVQAFGADLHRAKGFLPVIDGWRYLDWSAGRLEITPAATGPAGLALIVHPRAVERAKAFAAAIAYGDCVA